MDSETAKLKERDEKYTEQVQEWKGSLGPRKKVRYHHDEKLHHADCPYITYIHCTLGCIHTYDHINLLTFSRF
jgi:hypothetical protein